MYGKDREVYNYLNSLKINFKRKRLNELLKEDRPFVIVNGNRHRIKKRELDLLLKLGASGELKLPIILEIDANYESGTVKITGKEEVKIISKILNRDVNIFSDDEELFIYKPELRIVRRELPTTTAYIFRMSLD